MSNAAFRDTATPVIAAELKVGKRILIEWGRKFRFEIHNARLVELEALRERYLALARIVSGVSASI